MQAFQKIDPQKLSYFEVAPDTFLRYARFCERPGDSKAEHLIFIIPGKSEFIEKYTNVIDHWLKRNFDVIILELRGQGLSTPVLVQEPQKCHIDNFTTYAEDITAFVKKVIDPLKNHYKQILVLAHSLGAHCLLRSQMNYKFEWQGMILSSPFLDLHLGILSKSFAMFISKMMILKGAQARYALGQENYKALSFVKQKLTHDKQMYKELVQFLKENPNYQKGGVTYQWLYESLISCHFLKKSKSFLSFKLLILAPRKDQIVSSNAIQHFARHQPQSTYLEIMAGHHELFFEKKPIQVRVWKKIDLWLKTL